MVQVAFSFMVVKKSFRRKEADSRQAGLACMIYEALLTCVPFPSLSLFLVALRNYCRTSAFAAGCLAKYRAEKKSSYEVW